MSTTQLGYMKYHGAEAKFDWPKNTLVKRFKNCPLIKFDFYSKQFFAHVSLSNRFPTIEITKCTSNQLSEYRCIFVYSFCELFGHFLTKLYNNQLYWICK